MRDIALVLPEKLDETAVLKLIGQLSGRHPLGIWLCSRSQQLSDSQLKVMAGLEAIGAAVSAHLSVTPETLKAMSASLVLIAWTTSQAPAAEWRTFIRDLSRRMPAPVWIMNGHAAAPSTVTALIDSDGADRIDPHLAADVLRVSFTLARALDVPLDIINVWYFLEEGLLRSWRLRTPEPEINEKKRRAAWIAQSDLARLLAALSPVLSWRRLDCLQGPVTSCMRGRVSEDTLIVTGSSGRDGWVARFRPSLAEDLCRQRQAPIVIVKKLDAKALALLNGTTLQDRSDTDTSRFDSSENHRKKGARFLTNGP